MIKMKFCSKCGNQMADDMLFCQKCGTRSVVENTDTQETKNQALKQLTQLL